MIAAFVVSLSLSAKWVEITNGLQPNDDISITGYGNDPDDIIVGTINGYVYRTRDGGQTYQLIFWPVDLEYKLQRPLLNYMALDPTSTRSTINLIERCDKYIYLVTPETLWRSSDDGLHFERTNTAAYFRGYDVWWITCDNTRPGRIAISSAGGIFESQDWGDTFSRFRNPFPDGFTINTMNFRSNGRLIVLQNNVVYRERFSPAEGYDRLCDYGYGDGVDSNKIVWIWWAEMNDRFQTYAVTNDGILLCDNGKVRRFTNIQFGRRAAAFVWLDWTTQGHMFAATDRDVWETWDDGETWTMVFDAPTQRSLRKLSWNPKRGDDLLVITGGQIFRRIPEIEAAKRPWLTDRDQTRVDHVLAKAPQLDVVLTALERIHMEPAQLAAERNDSLFRALMPDVRVTVGYNDSGLSAFKTDRLSSYDPTTASTKAGTGTSWTALLSWNLSGLVYDTVVADKNWSNVERIRDLITYRVQDTWMMWAQALTTLAVPGLPARQRAYQELKRREAASYLNEMTGGQFEIFTSDLPPVRAKE